MKRGGAWIGAVGMVLAAAVARGSVPGAGAGGEGAPTRAEEPVRVKVEQVAEGLNRPVGLAFAPDGRLFVIEQFEGAVRVVKDGKLQEAPWAKMPDPVWNRSAEGGLVGLCVDPEFNKNGFVYGFYTVNQRKQRVVRFTDKEGKGVESKVIVDDLPTLGINHNGGGLGFGPDGKLYVSVGESGRRPEEAQDQASLRGKLLRYNADGTIPADNPFKDSPVFCLGLRNTFRFAFDPEGGALYGSENGPNDSDEVNRLEKGKNYGWPEVRGKAAREGFVDPLIVHTPCPALTGILVYRGRAFPGIRGRLVYGAFYFGSHGTVYHAPLGGDAEGKPDALKGFRQGGVTDLAVDAEGRIYAAIMDGYGQSRRGELVRLVPMPAKAE